MSSTAATKKAPGGKKVVDKTKYNKKPSAKQPVDKNAKKAKKVRKPKKEDDVEGGEKPKKSKRKYATPEVVPEKDLSTSTIFVSTIPYDATSVQLEEFFGDIGPIRSCFVVADPKATLGGEAKNKGIGYVTYALHEDAEKAINALKKKKFLGKRQLKMKIAKRRSVVNPKSKTKSIDEKVASVLNSTGLGEAAQLPMDATSTLININGVIATTKRKLENDKKDDVADMAGLKKAKLLGSAASLPKELQDDESDDDMFGVNEEASGDEENDEVVESQEVESEEYAVVDDKEFSDVDLSADDYEDVSDDESIMELEDDKEGKNGNLIAELKSKIAKELKSAKYTQTIADEIIAKNEEKKDESERPKSRLIKKTPGPNLHTDTNETTIFIRNVSYETTQATIEEAFKTFGELRYARVTMDKFTGKSKGTAFVCFMTKESFDTCMEQYEKDKISFADVIESAQRTTNKANEKKDNKVSQDSLLIPELPAQAQTSPFYIDNRYVALSPAVSRTDANTLMESNRVKKIHEDKRNLYLMKEGVIFADSDAAKGLTPEEVTRRVDSFSMRKRLLAANPNMYLSKTRLSVRGVPLVVDDKELKKISALAVTRFHQEVKRELRADLDDAVFIGENKDITPEEIAKIREDVGKKVKIVQAKILRSKERIDSQTKLNRSKGAGFVEFANHWDAIACLRWMNNNLKAFSTPPPGEAQDPRRLNKRPIVEFAIENIKVVKRRTNMQKGNEANEDDNDRSRSLQRGERRPFRGGSSRDGPRGGSRGGSRGGFRGSSRGGSRGGRSFGGDRSDRGERKPFRGGSSRGGSSRGGSRGSSRGGPRGGSRGGSRGGRN